MSGRAGAIVTPGPFNQQGMPRRDGFNDPDGSLSAVGYRFLLSLFNEVGRIQGLGPPPPLQAQVEALQQQIAALQADVTTLRSRLP